MPSSSFPQWLSQLTNVTKLNIRKYRGSLRFVNRRPDQSALLEGFRLSLGSIVAFRHNSAFTETTLETIA
jgi:hypothetical protein